MKTKKQIDRLFRERFKDFEAAPPSGTWARIQAELHQKKKERRIIPLWYKIATTAAVLLLLVSVGNYFFNNQTIETPIITDTQVKESDIHNYPNNSQEHQLVDKADDKKTNKNNFESFDTNGDTEIVSVDVSNATKSRDEPNTQATPRTTTHSNKDQVNSQEAIAQSSTPVATTDESGNSDRSSVNVDKQITVEENSVASKKENQQFIVPEEYRTKDKSKVANIEDESKTEENNTKSLIEYLEERDAEAHETTMADATPQERWMITPNIAPVYYNTLGSGSSIDPKFSNSPKSGEVNYSYGVQVGYAINKKLSVRAGINKVNMGYTTNNIEFTAVPKGEGLMAVDYGNASYVVTVAPAGSLPSPSDNIPTSINGQQIVPRNGNIEGSMSQNLGYYEVPLELKYNFIDKKFGFHMVGGLSTLFLDENTISVMSNGFESVIGEASNLNDVSFSANFGLGVDYKLSRRFVLNVEPMFKYQLNAYTNTDTDFRPYFIGVYSGLSFRF